jgi:hypothetical protein
MSNKNCCALLERWFRTRACCRASSAGGLLGLHWGELILEAQSSPGGVKTKDPTIAQSIGGAFLRTRFAKRYRLTNIHSSATGQLFPAKRGSHRPGPKFADCCRQWRYVDPAPRLHRLALTQESPLVRFAASVSSAYFTRRGLRAFLSTRF